MLGLGAGMGAVTRGAGPALLPVHMQEVQVELAIAEVGQLCCLFLPGNILVMAAETEIILGRAVCVIKIHRKRPSKKFGKSGTVNHAVACRTVSGLNRSMFKFGIRHFVTEFNVALEAELLHSVIEQRLIIGRMGAVAIRAAAFINRHMLEFCGGDILEYPGA